MDKTFDFYAYMANIAAKNRFAQARSFHPCTCSGINYLEEPLNKFRTKANFICTSDVCDESTYQKSGGYFNRRSVMVFILMRYRQNDEADRRAKMADCRSLLRQIQSRLVRDNEKLVLEDLYLNIDVFRSSELGGIFLNGCTGLYFMISVDEPTDLQFNPEEWED